jgi:large subunit ribosomal protein L28
MRASPTAGSAPLTFGEILSRRPIWGILFHSRLGKPLIKSEFHMSKVCVICGKKPSFGNNRSHSMRATPRRWDPNVQKVHIELDGKPTQAYVCAKCLKAHKVTKVV